MRPVKTSETHPLPLASVNAPGCHGRILFTMCPGKKQPHADTGPWDRDLDTDMQAVANAGTSIMVTLLEAHEIEACALSPEVLTDACATHKIEWHHCPIPDFNAPDSAWEQQWLDVGKQVRHTLRTGSTILLHCRGGRGRAGMIAARLLVEMGCAPDDAITMVRAQRPEAIETPPQEEHVRGIAAVTDR